MTDLPLEQPRKTTSPLPRICSKFTLAPIKNALRRKLFRLPYKDLETIADRVWQIAPGITTTSRPAYFLPNQLERITGSAYTPNPEREMVGGYAIFQQPTRGFLVKNAWLVDGSIYRHNEKRFLYPRTGRWPQFRVENEIDRGAAYSSGDGLEFFGRWLTEDCAAYPLAMNEGVPITSDRIPYMHAPDYEAWLEMNPVRFRNAFLSELVFFDDAGENQHKRARFQAMGEKVLARVEVKPHPGVFILRRSAGKKRVLPPAPQAEGRHLHRIASRHLPQEGRPDDFGQRAARQHGRALRRAQRLQHPHAPRAGATDGHPPTIAGPWGKASSRLAGWRAAAVHRPMG